MPRYIDLTAELMGDPSASERRAPTLDEMTKPGAYTYGYQVDRKRGQGSWGSWQIGEERCFPTRHQAMRTRDQIRINHGYRLKANKSADGTYTLTRVE